jgi:hypothetical protein
MKKMIFLLLVVGFISSCTTNKTLIQRSDVAIENVKTNEVYFCECGMGVVTYNMWIKEGVENGWVKKDMVVYLVDSTTFSKIPYRLP